MVSKDSEELKKKKKKRPQQDIVGKLTMAIPKTEYDSRIQGELDSSKTRCYP